MNDNGLAVDRVAELIRDKVSGEVSVTHHRQGERRLALALGAESPSRSWHFGLAFGLAAAVLLAFLGLQASRLSYTTQQQALVFSDGSRILRVDGATGHVQSAGFRGAEYALQQGTVEVEVVHRSFSSWKVQAGPFTVLVRGTRFAVSWSEQTRRFSLDLHEGSVEVRGGLLEGGRMVSTGERLIVDEAAGRIRVEPASKRENPPPPLAPSLEPTGPLSTTSASAAQAPASVGELGSAGARTDKPRTDATPAVPAAPWSEKVAAGDFRGVVEDARARGIEGVLASAGSADLSALADAARYLGDRALSTRALMSQRARFAGSERAALAAFLMGKLEDERGQRQSALTWYQHYLTEQPRGTFAQEALGRRMVGLRDAASAGALPAAREYLSRFPEGPRANIARQIVGQP